ncbi:MAG: cellulase family glycosylhydrolase [bacterium]
MRCVSRTGLCLALVAVLLFGCGDDDGGVNQSNNNSAQQNNNNGQTNDNNANLNNNNATPTEICDNQTDDDGDQDVDCDDSDCAGDPACGRWLYTSGNKIYSPDGQVWVGRGANLHDTRSCNACTWGAPDVAEVNRRVDALVDDWGADFMRLTLESYGSADGRTHWQSFTDDADYLADILEIVDHIGTKPGAYVLVSLWIHPTFDGLGWPTAATVTAWEALAGALLDYDYVLFGLVNEPESNFDGSQDAACWAAMNDTVQAIRDVEDAAGSPHHIVAVQGTRAWARVLDYYVANPITAGGGDNVAYETHVYDPTADFADRFETPSQTLPVVIGEYGPASGYMDLVDCQNLMDSADTLQVPHLAWTFHMRCPPNLLVENSGGGCGVDMALEPTEWGQLLMDHLATP